MVQLWVNLPARYKKSDPKYQNLRNADMQKVSLPDNGGEIEIIAGAYSGHKGSASTFSPIDVFNAKLKKGAKATFNFPAHYTTAILLVEGSAKVNGTDTVPQDNFAMFNRDGETFTIEAIEDAIVLVLSGEPLKEPIAAHGPFVMNTRQELVEAFDEFNQGKFGYLED